MHADTKGAALEMETGIGNPFGGVTLKPFIQVLIVASVSEGISFLGFMIFPDKRCSSVAKV